MAQLLFTGRLFECEGYVHTFEEMINSNRETMDNEELGGFANCLLNLEPGFDYKHEMNSPVVTRIQ